MDEGYRITIERFDEGEVSQGITVAQDNDLEVVLNQAIKMLRIGEPNSIILSMLTEQVLDREWECLDSIEKTMELVYLHMQSMKWKYPEDRTKHMKELWDEIALD